MGFAYILIYDCTADKNTYNSCNEGCTIVSMACTRDHSVASKVKIGLYHYAWISNRTFCLGKCHTIREFTHLMEVSHLMNAMSTDAIYNIAGVKNISKISSAKAA